MLGYSARAMNEALPAAARRRLDSIRSFVDRVRHPMGEGRPTRWSTLPGPDMTTLDGLPLLGNLLDFRNDRLALYARAAEAGPFVRFRLGRLPLYVITDAELVLDLLVDNADSTQKGRGVNLFMKPLMGEGLLSAEGATHRNPRKLLAPAFAPKRTAKYGETMVEETQIQVATWRDGDRIDVSEQMMQMTLAIAGKTLFSADIRNEAEQVDRGLTLAMRALVASLTSPLQLPYEVPLPRHQQMKKAVTLLDEIVYRLIADGRRNGTDRGDVMSILLLARDETDGTGLDDKQVRDEVMTLLLAGHETTANTLAWTMYELGRNPAITARLEAEIDGVLGGRPPTVEDLANLPYSLQVIEEAMRLHPPAYATAREAHRELELGGKKFPAHSIFIANILGIHHRPDYFPDPLVFNPDRMTVAAKKSRPRGQYLPFGAGPRVCIGSHFALMEAHLCLVTMAQQVRLVPVSDAVVQAEPLITLRPRGGIPMRVRRR